MNITIDDRSPQIQYIGSGWNATGNNDFGKLESYGLSFTPTSHGGDHMVYTFTGSSVHVYGTTWHNHGDYAVRIDDENERVFSGYTPTRGFQQLLFSTSGLTLDREHSITVTNRPLADNAQRQWLDIDYIVVGLPLPPDLQTTVIDDHSDAFSYTPENTPDSPVWQALDRPFSTNTSLVKLANHANTRHVSRVPGAKATLTFTGSSVQLFGRRGPDLGRYDIELDGRIWTGMSVGPWHETHTGTELFTVAGLEDREHTLIMTHAGADNSTLIEVDWAVVNSSRSANSASRPPVVSAPVSSSSASRTSSAPQLSSAPTAARFTLEPQPSPAGDSGEPNTSPPAGSLTSGPGSERSSSLGVGAGAGPGAFDGSTDREANDGGTPVGAVVGGVVGGLAALTLLVFLVWFGVRKRRTRSDSSVVDLWEGQSGRHFSHPGQPVSPPMRAVGQGPHPVSAPSDSAYAPSTDMYERTRADVYPSGPPALDPTATQQRGASQIYPAGRAAYASSEALHVRNSPTPMLAIASHERGVGRQLSLRSEGSYEPYPHASPFGDYAAAHQDLDGERAMGRDRTGVNAAAHAMLDGRSHARLEMSRPPTSAHAERYMDAYGDADSEERAQWRDSGQSWDWDQRQAPPGYAESVHGTSHGWARQAR